MTKLIVNGDDFGASEDVNLNIINSHKHGILTSATLIAYADAFDNAVMMANSFPNLGIGVHLTIDGEFTNQNTHPLFIDPKTGYFYTKDEVVKKIKKRYYSHSDLVEEYSRQIEIVLDAGIRVTHLDHHHHLHLYFPILNAMLEVSKKYNIKYIRPQRIITKAKLSIFNKTYREMHQFYLKRKSNTIDGYFGFLTTKKEKMIEDLQYALSSKHQVIELMTHPSKDNGEVNFLTDKDVLSLCKDNLTNYANI
jgi:predicted glycoside hydrolase/deacetylase ChbG (UPF0249 family)